jgi:hypothetical protein
VVESFNAYAGRRIDLFGVIDIVAVGHGHILGVQTTTGSNLSAREAKSLSEPRLLEWLRAGGRFELWGWRKVGPRGKRKTWQVRRVELLEVNFS